MGNGCKIIEESKYLGGGQSKSGLSRESANELGGVEMPPGMVSCFAVSKSYTLMELDMSLIVM